MFASTIFASVAAALITFASGANAQAVSIYYCKDGDFSGACSYLASNVGGSMQLHPGSCFNLAGLDNSVTSYAVTGGCCAWYFEKGCSVRMFDPVPNQAESALGSPFTDAASSFRCNFDCNGL